MSPNAAASASDPLRWRYNERLRGINYASERAWDFYATRIFDLSRSIRRAGAGAGGALVSSLQACCPPVSEVGAITWKKKELAGL